MRNTIILGSVLALLVACGDDEENENDNQTPAGATTFTVTFSNNATRWAIPNNGTGVANVPDGETDPGPALSGQSYSFSFDAAPTYPTRMDTTRLQLATMLVQSNDMFFAPGVNGIPLFDSTGAPIDNGDVTDQVLLWDAGTEVNDDDPASFPPNTGAGTDEDGVVTELSTPLTDLLSVVVTSEEIDRVVRFTVTVNNLSSAANSNETPISPVVWAIENAPDRAATDPGLLFTVDQPDLGEGLQAVAEDGDASMLAASLAARSGVIQVASPGVWAVHTMDQPFFTPGMPDRGDGLEAIAEDGSVAALAGALPGQAGIQSSGELGSAPTPPGGTVSFTVTAEPGDRLSLTTMAVRTNDWILSTPSAGVDLFDADGNAISGSLGELRLYDVGTEVDQTIAVGLDQVGLQAGADTGAVDPDTSVRRIMPAAFPTDVFDVTVTPGS